MEKILCVDIGNSNIVIGLFVGEKLQEKWRVTTHKVATTDEWVLLLSGLFAHHASGVEAAVIGSVVPSLSKIVEESLQKLLKVRTFHISGNTHVKMLVQIDNPSELGADRLINAYAAYDKYKKAAIVVDFGTATTFDVVSQEGTYLGGAISTGLNLSLQALVQNTAKLPMIDLKVPPRAIGKNTADSMCSGLLYGYGALTDGLIEKLQSELKDKAYIIATGGLAKLMHEQKLSKRIDVTDEDLTIWGMMRIYSQFLKA